MFLIVVNESLATLYRNVEAITLLSRGTLRAYKAYVNPELGSYRV